IQDVSAKIADNDEAGVVITQSKPLRVYENAPAASAAATVVWVEYTVVLTRAPEDNVRFVATPVPISERERRGGGRGVGVCIGHGVASGPPPGCDPEDLVEA